MNANDIQEKIACLPEISSVLILAIHNVKSYENVGAIIKLSESSSTDTGTAMTIQTLRDRLRSMDLVPLYKMPTILRILQRYWFSILGLAAMGQVSDEKWR